MNSMMLKPLPVLRLNSIQFSFYVPDATTFVMYGLKVAGPFTKAVRTDTVDPCTMHNVTWLILAIKLCFVLYNVFFKITLFDRSIKTMSYNLHSWNFYTQVVHVVIP